MLAKYVQGYCLCQRYSCQCRQRELSQQSIVDRTKGEAHFIRGYAYFTLLTLFGEVPLFTEPQVTYDQVLKPRTAREEITKQIIHDLGEAKKLLPSVKTYRGTDNLGRASKGAAQAFLAKFYVYEKRWEDAKRNS